jgi:4-alpha-glucanotransferase
MRLHDDFFYRRHNRFWKNGAMLKLSGLVSATGMTACAEDLGMIPDCVPEVLDSLKIASLEIQRMPKNPAREFADPAGYPYLSVCSTGTHDVSTLRGWWKEDPEKTQRYYENVLGMPGKAPDECTPEICSAIISAHLQSPSAFAVFPLQDWLATFRHPGPYTPDFHDSNGTPTDEERINDPANPHHHWKYRMPVTLESLIEDTDNNLSIRNMIEDSGR